MESGVSIFPFLRISDSLPKIGQLYSSSERVQKSWSLTYLSCMWVSAISRKWICVTQVDVSEGL